MFREGGAGFLAVVVVDLGVDDGPDVDVHGVLRAFDLGAWRGFLEGSAAVATAVVGIELGAEGGGGHAGVGGGGVGQGGVHGVGGVVGGDGGGGVAGGVGVAGVAGVGGEVGGAHVGDAGRGVGGAGAESVAVGLHLRGLAVAGGRVLVGCCGHLVKYVVHCDEVGFGP